MTKVELVADLKLQLGEGAIWDWRTGGLRLVDIDGGKRFCWRPANGALGVTDMPDSPSFLALGPQGRLIVGNGRRLVLVDETERDQVVGMIDLPDDARINDGCVDASGRLWFGTMNVKESAGSGLHHCSGKGIIETAVRCRVPNGPAISADGRWLFHVDTLAGRIERFDLSADTALKFPEPFASVDPAIGRPDGITVDTEDHLWVCIWGAGEVRRYCPEGRLVKTVSFPVSQVTSIALGGDDFQTAFVTSARRGLTTEQLLIQPAAGGLFAFRAPTPGLPAPIAQLGASE